MDLDEQLQQCQSMTLGELVEMLDPPNDEEPEESDWDKIAPVLGTILTYAAEFEHLDYASEFALRCPAHLISHAHDDADAAAKETISNMAGLAWALLAGEGLSADTRARLERIRDADPEFVRGLE